MVSYTKNGDGYICKVVKTIKRESTMTGEKGMQYTKKKFTVYPERDGKGRLEITDFKKCFKDDCRNEGVSCEFCCMIQSKLIYYQPQKEA